MGKLDLEVRFLRANNGIVNVNNAIVNINFGDVDNEVGNVDIDFATAGMGIANVNDNNGDVIVFTGIVKGCNGSVKE